MQGKISSGSTQPEHTSVPIGRGELILIVDDELPICLVLSTIFKVGGYNVLVEHNGSDALATFEKHPEIRLVITDLTMPVMDGVVLIRELLKLAPEIRIIAATGRPDKIVENEIVEMGVRALLVKPFTRATLFQAVSSALADGPWSYQRLTG
ncbi:MAG: response regulator [Verrucomicrobiota bacterium]